MDAYEHIDDFIKGRLSDSDKLAFESVLSHDKELQSLVDNFKEISNVSEGLLELELLSEVKEVGQTLGSGSNWGFLKILLPVVLLLVVAFAGYKAGQNAKKLERQKVYFAANYERPDNPDTNRSTDVSTLGDLGKAKYNFELNEFEKAEATLVEIIKSSNDTDELNEAHFWLGHVYLNQYRHEDALEQFEKCDIEKVEIEIELTNFLIKL